MFGANPVAKVDHDTNGLSLHVVRGSPWETIQGEGPYAGHPASFIRLHGCNLRCTFCDTQFSDPDDPVMDVQHLAIKCGDFGHRLVVVTGGEPMRQNILPLCRLLHQAEFVVQIETAGTLWLEGIQDFAKIICSPKTPAIHPMIRKHAIAFKYVISTNDNHDAFVPFTATQPGAKANRLAQPRSGAPIYLSPMDEGEDQQNLLNRKLVAKLALEYNVIAGLQIHKFLGVD